MENYPRPRMISRQTLVFGNKQTIRINFSLTIAFKGLHGFLRPVGKIDTQKRNIPLYPFPQWKCMPLTLVGANMILWEPNGFPFSSADLMGLAVLPLYLFPQVVPLFRHRQLDSLRFERIDVKGARPNDFFDRSQGQTFLWLLRELCSGSALQWKRQSDSPPRCFLSSSPKNQVHGD